MKKIKNNINIKIFMYKPEINHKVKDSNIFIDPISDKY